MNFQAWIGCFNKWTLKKEKVWTKPLKRKQVKHKSVVTGQQILYGNYLFQFIRESFLKQPVGVGKLSPQMVQWFPLLIGRVIESLLDDLTAGCGLPLQNLSCVLSACVVLKFELHFEHWKLISWFEFVFMVKVKQTSGGGGGGIEVERRRSATIPASGIWLSWVCLNLQNLTWVLIPFFLKNLWQKQQAIILTKNKWKNIIIRFNNSHFQLLHFQTQ